MQVSVFYLPSIGSRSEIDQGMAGLRGDLYILEAALQPLSRSLWHVTERGPRSSLI